MAVPLRSGETSFATVALNLLVLDLTGSPLGVSGVVLAEIVRG